MTDSSDDIQIDSDDDDTNDDEKEHDCEHSKNDHLKGSCVWPKEIIQNKTFANTFSCIKCNGIPRSCMSDENGAILCCGCSKYADNAKPVIAVQIMINALVIKCLSTTNNDDNNKNNNDQFNIHYNDSDNDDLAEEGANLLVTTHKCGWKGKLEDYKQHCYECLFMIIECNKCKEHQCKRKDINKHLDKCPQNLIDCSNQCGQKVRRKHHWHHKRMECPESMLDCPNYECTMQIRRKNIDKHTKNDCEERTVICEYKQYGCIANDIKAKYLKHHMETNKDMHLSVVTKNLNEKIEQQQKVIDEQQIQLNQIQDFLKSVRVYKATSQNIDDVFGDQKNNFNEWYGDTNVLFDVYDEQMDNDITIMNDGKKITLRDGTLFVFSSKGYSKGYHKWNVKLLEKGSCHSIGIASIKDATYRNGDNIFNKNLNGQLGDRYIYVANGGFNDSIPAPSILSVNNNKMIFKEINDDWNIGDTVTIKLNCNDWTITFLKSGKELFDAINIKKKQLYYPVFQGYNHTTFEIIDDEEMKIPIIDDVSGDQKNNFQEWYGDTNVLFDVYDERMENNITIMNDGKKIRLTDRTIAIFSSNGYSKGYHKWSVKLLEVYKCQAIGIAARKDPTYRNGDNIFDEELNDQLGDRYIYAGDDRGGYGYGSQKRPFIVSVHKDKMHYNNLDNTWECGDIVTIKLNCNEWTITFLKNGKNLSDPININKKQTYYPVFHGYEDTTFAIIE